MAEDKDPLVDEDEDEQENGEEELPESPALVDHTVETSDVDLSSRGVTFVKEPSGKLTQVPTE